VADADGVAGARGFWSVRASRTLAFRLALAGLAASTLIGVTFALARPAEFRAAFPGAASPAAFAGLLAVGGAGLVAVAGLWHWRRWAVILYGIVAAASLALDVAVRAPAVHQAAVIVAALAVLGLAYANRARFGAGPAGGAA
jgi:hypothetical protein